MSHIFWLFNTKNRVFLPQISLKLWFKLVKSSCNKGLSCSPVKILDLKSTVVISQSHCSNSFRLKNVVKTTKWGRKGELRDLKLAVDGAKTGWTDDFRTCFHPKLKRMVGNEKMSIRSQNNKNTGRGYSCLSIWNLPLNLPDQDRVRNQGLLMSPGSTHERPWPSQSIR